MSSVKYTQILSCKYVHNLFVKLLTKSGYNGIIYIETRKKQKIRKKERYKTEKQDKIKETLRSRVTEAWETLTLYHSVFGVDSDITNRQRTKWATLDMLWRDIYDEEY